VKQKENQQGLKLSFHNFLVLHFNTCWLPAGPFHSSLFLCGIELGQISVCGDPLKNYKNKFYAKIFVELYIERNESLLKDFILLSAFGK
jgi:hypothetical protein